MKKILLIVSGLLFLLPVISEGRVSGPGNALIRSELQDSLDVAQTITNPWNFSGGVNAEYFGSTATDLEHFLNVSNSEACIEDSVTTEGLIAYNRLLDVLQLSFGSRWVSLLGVNRSWSYPLVQPDSVQVYCDTVMVQKVTADEFPFGVTITKLTIGGTETLSDVVAVLELSTAGALVGTVGTVTCAGKETTTSGLTYSVTAGNVLAINLDDTPQHVKQWLLTIVYRPN